MTQPQPGWYPDPGAPAGAPPHVRYWDGSTWTHHVQPTYAGPPAAARPTGPTTADGQPLAGWWWRVLAQVIDGFIISIAVNLITLPIQIDMQRRIQDLSERYLPTDPSRPTDVGGFVDAVAGVYRDHIIGLLVVPVVLVLAYIAGFLRWKGATPGKLVCGLRIRLRERPGTLPWSTIAVRLLVQNVLPGVVFVAALASGTIAGLVLGYLAFLGFFALDALWATWNKNRQTIHDLAARTQVVKVR